MSTLIEKRFDVWQGGLSGRFYAGWAKRRQDTPVASDLWEAVGVKHDVTEAVHAIIRRHGGEVS